MEHSAKAGVHAPWGELADQFKMGFEAMLLEFRVAGQLEIDFVARHRVTVSQIPTDGEVYQEPPPTPNSSLPWGQESARQDACFRRRTTIAVFLRRQPEASSHIGSP